ncbi:disease resistance protein SUMM2-like [Helianthus annuus]|uniref:disease resistance protein SUMM2-like n=1 Tax=Helianthus annuus TaxID=4232 RepID=UPI001652F317|nr:disease resistance protein SUMM2-like [Helianthus annuus]
MAGNIVQVVAAAVQAVANVGDAGASLGSLATTAVNAKPALKNSHSRMVAKMINLHKIRRSVEDHFRIYWFPRKRVDLWLSEVERIELQVMELKDKFSEFDQTWGIHPYAALTEEINVMCTEIDEVLREGKKMEDDLVKPETRRIVELATPISIANVSPLNEKLEQLLEYLKDQSYDTIRVHGVAGTGKRVLIQHVNNHEAIANKMFDIVLWLPASDYENHDNDYSREVRVQHIIARRLGLDLGDITDVNVLASKIRGELDGAKYMLLLDDLKSNIELETIGIPRNKNGSKVVFTTYLRHVFPFGPLTRSTQFFNIEIKKLSEADSWQMFEDILINENDTIQQHEIGTIARKVVKWCDGLFSLIYIVAQNFKSKRSPQNWSDGLQMLRRPAKMGDIYKKALESFLNFSYGGLEENQKLCFLFTVLYPEGSKIPIDCLFDCWTTHKFLVHGAPESSRCSNKQYVTIDKVFRTAAMELLQERNQYKYLVAEEALEKLKNDNCKDTHWISLSGSEIDDLPDEVDCPELTTLFLQKNSKPETISSSFFKKMKDLIILDLYKTGSEMMIPMSDLQKLKVLYVNGSAMLKKLPFKIEGLDHMLEVLDIRDCIMNELPRDIKKLKHLRRLMVSINGGGTLHPIICELSSLKELIFRCEIRCPHK